MGIVSKLILVMIVAAVGGFAQRNYTATPIQAPGFVLSSLVWLSDDGRVGFGSGLNLNANGTTSSQCFRYQDGMFTTLPRGDSLCAAAAGNDRGQFVGVLSTQGGSSTSAFVYDDGRYFSLNRFLPDQTRLSVAQSINQRGDITGFFYANPQTITYTGPDGQPASLIRYSNQYAFLFSNHQMAQLPTLGGPNTQAVAINAYNDAAGASDVQNSQTHAVIFPRTGGIVDLGTLGGYYSRAVAINSSGQIAGDSTLTQDPRDVTYHAVQFDGSTMRPIQLPGVDSRTVWMNDNGEVVGAYRNADGLDHPFYYSGGIAVDLNNRIVNPSPGMSLSTPQYINNQGQILVMGVLGGDAVQFLLSPIT